MSDPVKSLTDAELADIRDQEQWTSPWRTDIPRLLATVDELKAILADCQQDSLAYLAGVREGEKKAALKLYHWYGVLEDYYKGDCVVLASSLEEARQRAIAGLGREKDQESVRTHEPDVYEATTALFFNGSA